MTLNITPIGTIHTPFKDLSGMPIQPSGAIDVEGSVVLDREYEQGLNDIDGFSHIILLYHFHKSRNFDLMVTPFLDKTKRGLFSTRAPRRPNPIGLSIVRIVKRDGNVLVVKDIDVLNNTPLIDIKPYVPRFDIKDVTKTGWLEKTQADAATMSSDNRFIEKESGDS